MKQLSEGWKPSDVDHAVRIHRALVEQGDERHLMDRVTRGPWKLDQRGGCLAVYPSDEDKNCLADPGPWAVHYSSKGQRQDERTGRWSMDYTARKDAALIAASRSLIPALVEGAKAVLKTYEEYEGDQIRDVWLCACDFVESQAAAYAPKMIDAGMEVPE